uniref:Cytochrome P450 n=1 Tax=Oryza nivara TaxID=4536 RepID=A0A0E0IPH4_ORYNI
MAIFIGCICSLALLLLCSHVFQLLSDARRRLPPGPRPLPVIGNLLDVAGELPHRSLACVAERYGPLVTLRLGTMLAVVASSPATARDVLHRHGASITDRGTPDAWSTDGHDSNSIFAFPTRHHRWRALRRLGAEQLFSPRRVEEQRPLRRDAVRGLLRHVAELAAASGGGGAAVVDVGRAAFAAMASLLFGALFSAGIDAATSCRFRDAAREFALLTMTPNVSEFFPVVAMADLQGLRRRTARHITWMYQLIDGHVERRMRGRETAGGCGAAHGEKEKDLLDVMLDMSEKEEQNDDSSLTMNRGVIRAFMADLLMAGSETSSAVIEWAMAELLQNPQTMTKLQEELKKVIGSKTCIDEEDIDQLPYLQAVIKETHRLHPAIPLLMYKAAVPVEIQGYKIPKETTVIVNTWAIHQNSEVWIEPDKFIPERFLQKEISLSSGSTNMELIPFSAGRRFCLGYPVANRMLHVMLASLVHQFQWTLPEVVKKNGGVDMAEKFGITLSMATPLHAIAKNIV